MRGSPGVKAQRRGARGDLVNTMNTGPVTCDEHRRQRVRRVSRAWLMLKLDLLVDRVQSRQESFRRAYFASL
jgi:hypothetical protein